MVFRQSHLSDANCSSAASLSAASAAAAAAAVAVAAAAAAVATESGASQFTGLINHTHTRQARRCGDRQCRPRTNRVVTN